MRHTKRHTKKHNIEKYYTKEIQEHVFMNIAANVGTF